MSNTEILTIVKAKMEAKGFSVYRLAKESGVPQQTLNDWISGKSDLGVSKVEKVFAALKIKVKK